MRVGTGYDAHRLRPGRKLIIGGVRIEHPTGLDGHSDADVLTHAVIDAIFGASGRSNQGWNDQRHPQVDNEWWCVRDCPAGKGCAGQCLEDPADDHNVVCATDHVELQFYSRGTSCVCEPTSRQCFTNAPVSGFDVTTTCTNTTVTVSCGIKSFCSAGTFAAGAAVPAVRLHGNGTLEMLYCPAQPSSLLGPQLPDGKPARIYVDLQDC